MTFPAEAPVRPRHRYGGHPVPSPAVKETTPLALWCSWHLQDSQASEASEASEASRQHSSPLPREGLHCQGPRSSADSRGRLLAGGDPPHRSEPVESGIMSGHLRAAGAQVFPTRCCRISLAHDLRTPLWKLRGCLGPVRWQAVALGRVLCTAAKMT